MSPLPVAEDSAEQLALLGALFATVPTGVQIRDAHGREVLSNETFRAFGTVPIAEADWTRALRGELVGPVELKLGSGIMVRYTLRPLRAGEKVYAAGAFKDVTAEHARNSAADAAEHHLRLVVANAPVAFFSLDALGRYTYVSGQRLRRLGVEPSDLVGRSALEVNAEDPVSMAALRRALAGETVTFRAESPAGGTFEARLVPSFGADGEVTGLFGVSFDVSEQVRAQELARRSQELHLENQRIVEASRLKSRFLASMSHELRTPLNAVIGFAELLHDRPMEISAAQQQEFTGHIIGGGKHLLHLIDDLLDMAKVESGKQDFRPEPVDLAALVSEVCVLLGVVASDKRVVLVTELDPSLSDVVIDPARFKQVVFNYLSNALKFSPEGGRVTVRTLPEGERAFRLEVQDQGPGIAPADVGRLFRDFQQLREGTAAPHRGTGLGLALTRGIVEAQGGSVALHSKPGEGSTFIATLPRQHMGRMSTRPPTLSAPSGPCRVLVVEDDARDSERIVDVLVGAGHTVVAVERGGAALELCQRQQFDAVTIDLLLPDTSGLALISAIRMTNHHSDLPVLVVSEVSDPRVLAGLDVQDVLPKPITSTTLLSALHRALSVRRV